MKELKLTKYVQTNATVLDNEFIDQYMVRANGEYVKVYLLLLRHMNQSSGCLSVSELADLLECTEKDVLRALRYWKSEGLLDYLDDTPDDPTPQSTVRSSVPTSELHDVQSGYMTASVPSMTNQMDYPVDSVEAPVSAVPAVREMLVIQYCPSMQQLINITGKQFRQLCNCKNKLLT